MRNFEPVPALRCVRMSLMAAALLIGIALTGCQTNPADAYRTGYDKMLTPKSWAERKPDQAVVIVGGYPAVWQKAGDQSYVFETRPRITINWSHGYDVALIDPGTYQLQTIVLVAYGNQFADFGGFRGLGAASGPVIASFKVAPGDVVYVGNLGVEVITEAIGTCSASLRRTDSSTLVAPSFAKHVPYVDRKPTTSLMTVVEPLIRFPCGAGE